ncbi:MAG TPA: hypothetical protein VK164_10485 [Flavobacterium sp.]|uniref:hypothetical protein n=1 Tax=Flavobacterium sp. TaxID=239 RepID=UPI002B4AF508|nr:hypothetical protein [Flavobacterium sp.]HLO74352.1 hypothetical protein [Flavobacterium sp.]
MKEQKNIERLFQEKFKDFEAIPPQDSWNNIASRLAEKKKKKRVIPFWFQFSGIAASLVIIGALIWNYQSENNNSIIENNNSIVSEDSNQKTNNNSFENKNITNSESNKLDEKSSDINQNYSNDLIKSKNVVVSNSNENTKTNDIIIKHKKSTAFLVNNTTKNKTSKNKRNKTKKDNLLATENLIQNELNNSNENDLVLIQNQKEDLIANTKNINSTQIEAFYEKENSQITYTNNKNDSKINDTINTIVASNEIIIKDSTLVVKIAEKTNPLEELLATKEDGKNEDEKEKEKRNRWAISSNASPVYFNSLAEGSSLDQQFDSNEKNYTTTLSYGIGGSYLITNKISIKTGINNINLSYNTNDVLFRNSLSVINNNVKALSRNENSETMVFSVPNSKNDIGDAVILLSEKTGTLKQDLSYIEIPLELSYKILDKKFGIEVIGGMSTLFLNNNTVSLVTDGMEMNIGKANNLNNIHFSSNVGLGFKYSFWKNFNANFQPMFKYQINTFSENSGNFKPYFVGLYSGISFSF